MPEARRYSVLLTGPYNQRMGKWLHRLSEVDHEKRTAVCATCGPVRIRHGGYAKKSGQIVWRCIKTANR